MLSFTERMAQGRDIAANARYHGKSTGKPAKGHVGSAYARYAGYSELDKLQHYFESWRYDWQYEAAAAVETELFAHDWTGGGFGEF